MRYFFVKSHKKYVFLFTKTVEQARKIKHFRKKRRVKTLQKLTVFLTYKTLKNDIFEHLFAIFEY